jgi:hypothetical protein
MPGEWLLSLWAGLALGWLAGRGDALQTGQMEC